MRNFRRLSLHHLVGQIENLLKLIAEINEYLIRPLGVLDIVDSVLPLSDDAKVVAGSSQSPEEVGVLVIGRCDELPIGKNNFGRDDLVRSQPILALKPPVATSQNWGRNANALANSCHFSLLAKL